MASKESGPSPPPLLGVASGAARLAHLIGRTVGGYRVERLVGRGGMGAVFEAVHPYIERRAAIKVLYPELSENPQFAARFLNEARAVNLVQHPGLVQIFEFGVLPDGVAYIIMEFLSGETLNARLDRAAEHRLPDAEALDVARQVAAALAAAHDKDIVHRDLKPDNVMLVADPERKSGERCKVLDFGVAKMASREGDEEVAFRTKTGVALGTPEYMSPEQCIGALSVDGQSDVYALGVMLYEMFSGELPFTGVLPFDVMAMHVRTPPPLLRQAQPLAPEQVETLVHIMMSKDAARRPTMRQVAAELERLGGTPSRESLRAVPKVRLDKDDPAQMSRLPTQLLETPLLDELPLSRTEPATPTPTPRTRGEMPTRVLVVDDEPDLASTVCSMLEHEGFRCHTVHDGSLVMEAVRGFHPDLVLLDVELPGKSGYKLCWEIKSAKESASLPVILLSAKGQETDHKLGMAMQADAYMDKPFQFDELLAVIQLLLDRPG